jgi:formylglycine-generating enzyme required for sulfatase activity
MGVGAVALSFVVGEDDAERATPARAAVTAEDPSRSTHTGMRFERIQAGEFWMGSPSYEANRQSDEQERKISITQDLWVAKYEVTQNQFEAVMGYNPSNLIGGRRPVTNLTWLDAVRFCNDLSSLDGYEPVYTLFGSQVTANWSADGYRLPTAAEWEFAAGAGGTESTTWAGDSSPGGVAWTKENSSGRPHDVGTKRANGAGLYDMSGNVYEWVWDWNACHENTNTCDAQYGKSGGSRNPRGPSSGLSKVKKGGSSAQPSKSARIANHAYYAEDKGYAYTGLRLVRLAE